MPHRARHPGGSQAPPPDRPEQRALPADARRAAQARGLRGRRRLRRARHHRAPLPLRGLRDLGGTPAHLRRPRRAHRAHQVLPARPRPALVGPDPRRRGAGRPRPSDQGAHLRRIRPRLPGPLGQRAGPAVPRHRRADGRLLDRQPQPQGLRGDGQGHQEGVDRGGVGLRRRVLQGSLPLQGGDPALAGGGLGAAVRRTRRDRRRGRGAQVLGGAAAPPRSRIRRCSSRSR